MAALSALLAAATVVTSQPAPALVFESQVAHYGETYAFAEVEGHFDLTNRSARVVRLRALTPQAPGGTVVSAPSQLQPGEHCRISVRQALGARLGQSRFRFELESDDVTQPTYKLLLTGFVQSAYDPETTVVDFGSVDRRTGATRDVRLATREADRLGLRAIEEAPPWLAVERLPGDGPAEVRLRLTVRPDAPLGAHAGRVRLKTDLERQPLYEIGVRVAAFEGTRLDPPQAAFGLLRSGQESSLFVELRRDGSASAGLLGIESAPSWLRVAEEACVPDEASCRRLHLMARVSPAGAFEGVIRLRLQGSPDVVELPFAGLVVEDGREIRTLPLPMEGATAADTAPTGRTPVPSAFPSPSTSGQITVSWTARRDAQAFGYSVYRADQRAGPFLRMNPEILRVPADSAAEHSYHFLDRHVRGGRTYYYYVDVLTLEGRKQRLSGVLSRVAPPDAAPE